MSSNTAVAQHEAGFRFAVETGSGHRFVVDNAEGNAGPRPAELVVAGVAGCTAMDVISILRKKREDVTAYAVRVAGTKRDEHPHAFTEIDIVHEVDGPAVHEEAVRRAIELSATRYCTVSTTLASGAVTIHHRYLIRRGTPGEQAEIRGEALVTGPGRPYEAS